MNISQKIIRLMMVVSILSICNVQAESIYTKAEQQWLKENKSLVVGFPLFEYPPYIIQSNDGQVLGVFNDYLKLLASQLGLKLEYKYYSSTKLMEAAFRSKEIDLIAGFANTERRRKFMDFTQPFLVVPRSILIAKASEIPNKQSIEKIKHLIFAVEEGFASRNEIKSFIPDVKIFDVHGTPEAITAIKFGLADAYYGDWITNNYMLDKSQNNFLRNVALTDVPPDESRIAIQPNEPLFKSVLNKAIRAIDEGTHAFISARWNTSNLLKNKGKIPLLLTQEEQAWLKDNPEIKYATYTDLYPFDFTNKEGAQQGISAELIHVIAEKLGIKVTPIKVQSIDHSLKMLKGGDIDLLPAIAGVQADDSLHELSIPYHTSPWVVIAKANSTMTYSDIYETKIRIANSRGLDVSYLLKKKLPLAQVVESNSMAESIALLESGEVEVIFSLLSSTSPWLQGQMVGKFKILNSLSAEKNIETSFASLSENAILIDVFNKVLNEIGTEEITKINNKWSTFSINQQYDYTEYLYSVLAAVFIAVAIIMGVLFWNRKLKKEISQRALAEERAKRAEYELNSMADAIPGAVVQFIVRRTVEFTYISQGVEDLMPFTQKEIMANPELFYSLIPIEDQEKVLAARAYAAESLEAIDVEFRVIFDNGEVNWINMAAFPEQQTDYILWNAVLLKINDRKEQEFALSNAKIAAEQAAVAKSRFLAMMSHEIRTPVSGIIGMLELLSQSELSTTQKNDVKSIEDSANNLLHILNDVLDHSKVEAGQLTVECIEADLIQITETAMKTHANSAHIKGIGLKLNFDTNVFHNIYSDPVRLQQVISNLLSNAIKFTEKGEVTLSVTQQELDGKMQSLHFSIKDTGIGITPANQRKLFTPFTQAENSTSRKYGGTGLGLTICKMLVERLGGDIKVVSDLGQGTEFSFCLKVESELIEFKPELIVNKPVILIDDSSYAAQKVKGYLNKWGYSIVILPFDGEIERLTAIMPTGECVFICSEKLIEKYELSNINQSSTWIELSGRSFSPLPGHHYISTSPLFISGIIDTINAAQQSTDAELLDILANDSKLIASEQTREQAIAAGRLILVAEDHPTNQMVIKRQLEKLNFHADIVDDGQQALDAIYQQSYGLLLTDCHMPIMDGYELTKELRAQGSEIPIIALTANALTGEAERCKSMGMSDYLTKPVNMELLQQKLNQYLSNGQDHTLMPLDTIEVDDLDYLDQINDTSKDDLALLIEDIEDNTPASEKFDFTQLLDMFGDMETVNHIIEEFVKSTEESLVEIKSAMKANDLKELSLTAHRVKGAAGMICADSLQHISFQLEQEAKSGDTQDLTTLINDFETAFIAFKNETNINELIH